MFSTASNDLRELSLVGHVGVEQESDRKGVHGLLEELPRTVKMAALRRVDV